MNVFSCPICRKKLDISGKSYSCPNGHSFDVARSGYVNFLLSKHGGGVHGDNKLMVRARREFLEKGYYFPLCQRVSSLAAEIVKSGDVILDAGCGEGYYTSELKEKIDQSNIAVKICGIDISKTAVEFAAKRKSGIDFAVASVFDIPVGDESCDILLTMFAPYCGEEYFRVLKNGGFMIMAIPSENHLWELKKSIYDTPYKNDVKDYELENFEFLKSERVSFIINITEKEDIQSLFSMTPYYYKTGKKEQERLNYLEKLETQADFEILLYKKIAKE